VARVCQSKLQALLVGTGEHDGVIEIQQAAKCDIGLKWIARPVVNI
jgi:hypothetical protein